MHSTGLIWPTCCPVTSMISNRFTAISQACGGIPQQQEHRPLAYTKCDTFVTSAYCPKCVYSMCHELWYLFCFALISLQWRYMCLITDNLTVYNLSLRLTLKLRILSLCDGYWWITLKKGGQLCQKSCPMALCHPLLWLYDHLKFHYDDVTWTSCSLKSPVIQLFVRQIMQTHMK